MLQLLIPSTLLTLFWHCHRALLLLTLCNARYITGFIATNTSYIYQWLGSVHYVFKVIDIVMSLDCSEKGFVFVLPAYFSESSSSSCKYYCNKLRGVVLLMEIYLIWGVTCHLTQVNTHLRQQVNTARQACTRFTYYWGMEGWVDSRDWLTYTSLTCT